MLAISLRGEGGVQLAKRLSARNVEPTSRFQIPGWSVVFAQMPFRKHESIYPPIYELNSRVDLVYNFRRKEIQNTKPICKRMDFLSLSLFL